MCYILRNPPFQSLKWSRGGPWLVSAVFVWFLTLLRVRKLHWPKSLFLTRKLKEERQTLSWFNGSTWKEWRGWQREYSASAATASAWAQLQLAGLWILCPTLPIPPWSSRTSAFAPEVPQGGCNYQLGTKGKKNFSKKQKPLCILGACRALLLAASLQTALREEFQSQAPGFSKNFGKMFKCLQCKTLFNRLDEDIRISMQGTC